MYRASDLKLFKIIAITSNVLALFTILVCGFYFLVQKHYLYRDLALILLIFSVFFRVMIFVYKFNIIEKRMLRMVPPSLQHFEIASRQTNLLLIAYFVVFLFALFAVIFCYLQVPEL